MSADGSIVIETNIDDKNAQRELTRLNKQIKSIEDQLASKKQGRRKAGRGPEAAGNAPG